MRATRCTVPFRVFFRLRGRLEHADITPGPLLPQLAKIRAWGITEGGEVTALLYEDEDPALPGKRLGKPVPYQIGTLEEQCDRQLGRRAT